MTDQREQDIQKLCRVVKENSILFRYYSNSYDLFECTFCAGESATTEEELKHDLDCVVLIARDLSTRTEDKTYV